MTAPRIAPTIAVPVVFVAGVFMAIMDTTIVNVALPAIGRDFGVAAAALSGVNIGYLVSLAVFIPLSGWLGDRFGTRRVFLAALVAFTAASALCATATSLEQLTVCRVLQGAGGGMLTPVGLTMLFRTFPPARRIRAQRLLMVPTAVAPAVGPVLGGWLVDSVSWHWVFLVNVPIGLAALVFGLLCLPDYRLDRPGRFDIAGFLLAGGGFALVLYALSQGADRGWTSREITVPLLVGVAALASMVAVERRISAPMLDLGLFRDRLFRAGNLAMFPLNAAFIGTIYLFPLFLQEALGYDALHSGLATFPEALGVMTASQLVPRLYARIGPRRLMTAGATGMAACLGLLATCGAGTSPWTFRVVLYVLGFGLGHVMMSAQNAAFATIPAASTGRATPAFNMQRQLGGAFGTALVATLLTGIGTTGPGLTAYHTGFLVTAGLALLAALAALSVSDRDALGAVLPAPPKQPPVDRVADSRETEGLTGH